MRIAKNVVENPAFSGAFSKNLRTGEKAIAFAAQI